MKTKPFKLWAVIMHRGAERSVFGIYYHRSTARNMRKELIKIQRRYCFSVVPFVEVKA